MSTTIQDHPGLDAASFSASLIETPGLPHNLTVSGQVTGDYRVEAVHLVRAKHQPSQQMLVLDLTAKLGPVENPHPEFERIWPVEYKETPAKHRYTEVKIVSGTEHIIVTVIDAL